METFLNENFLLKNDSARILYHDYAKYMPIIDYHCHINPLDIAVDRYYESITEAWLARDHYKWRLIRANGTPEEAITGARTDDPYRLFQAFAAALPKAVGNPVYHWTYLELKRYFGITEQLNPATAPEIYETCNARLQSPDMSAQGLIQRSNVRVICTLDDPIDSLIYHRKIAVDPYCAFRVLPGFRPNRAVHLEDPGFSIYIGKLSDASGIFIRDFSTLCAALTARINFFTEMGCCTAVHTLEHCVYRPTSPKYVDAIFKRAMAGEAIPPAEAERYYTAVLLHLSREYQRRGWVMQLQFGCLRDVNTRMYRALGHSTGFDAINGQSASQSLAGFLNALEETHELPRMIIHSLNPADSEALASICGCFMADAGCPGKIQLGAAWWFNDTKSGIEKQLRDLANSTLLGNFVGMLTDIHNLLSYSRHEYFRRILCNFIGQMVEDGEYPADYGYLGKLVSDICYHNARRFFKLGADYL